MIPTLPLPLAFVLAMVPGAIAFVLASRVARQAGEPDMPERLWRFRIACGRVAFAALIAFIVFSGSPHIAWVLVPAVLAWWLAMFPLVRRIYAGWPLASFLGYRLRLFIGGTSYYVALASLPWIVNAIGVSRWGFVLFVMLVWTYFAQAILLRAYDASPLPAGELRDRLEALHAKIKCPAPEIMTIFDERAHALNAYALPRLRRGAVLLSRRLLATLDQDEVTAIYAHELAHLEHYDPKSMRWRSALLLIAIAAICMAMPFLLDVHSDAAPFILFGWPLLIVVASLSARVQRRGHESACDVRAVAITGDPATLERALTHLHEAALLSKGETALSHPSLVDRVAAIRRAAAGEPPLPAGPIDEDATSRTWTRAFAGLAIVVTMLASVVANIPAAPFLCSLLAILFPSAAMLGGIAASSVLAVIMSFAIHAPMPARIFCAILIVLAFIATGLAIRRRNAGAPRVHRDVLLLVGVAIVLGAFVCRQPWEQVVAAIAPAVAMVGGAALFTRNRAWRAAGVLLLLAVLPARALEHTLWLRQLRGLEPLMSSREFVRSAASPKLLAEVRVPFPASEMSLEPDGSRVVFTEHSYDEDDATDLGMARVATFGQPDSTPVLPAMDVAFPAPDTVVLLRTKDVSVVHLGGATTTFPIPDLEPGDVRSDGTRWMLDAHDRHGNVVRFEAPLSGGAITTTRLPTPDASYWYATVGQGGEALLLHWEKEHTDVALANARGARKLFDSASTMHVAAQGDHYVACAFHDSRADCGTIDARGGIHPAGFMRGKFLYFRGGPGDIIAISGRDDITLLNLRTGRNATVHGKERNLVFGRDTVAIATSDGDGSAIRLYSLDAVR